jgi:hypothetical protein
MDVMNTSSCSVYKQGSPGHIVEFMLCLVCGNGIVHRHAYGYHNMVTRSCDNSQGSVNVMYVFKW